MFGSMVPQLGAKQAGSSRSTGLHTCVHVRVDGETATGIVVGAGRLADFCTSPGLGKVRGKYTPSRCELA
jgi:hypothetical protein